MVPRLIALFFAAFLQGQGSFPVVAEEFPVVGFESKPPRDAKLKAIASDGAARTWAIGSQQGAVLYLLEEEKWKTVSLPDFSSAWRPLALETDHEGRLLCLWKDESSEKGLVVSRHDPTNHTVVSRIPVVLEDPHLMPLRSGGALLSESGPQLVHCGIQGTDPEILVLPKEAFTEPDKREDGSINDDYLPIRAFEDDKGVLWLWSQSMKRSQHLWRLASPFTLDVPNKLSPFTLPKTAASSPISLISATSKDTFAICVSGTGLFEINSETGKKRVIQSSALKYTERIFMAGGHTYILSTPRPTEMDIDLSKTFRSTLEMKQTIFYNPDVSTSNLLRLDDTKLIPLTNKLDAEPQFDWFDRSIVETRDGFWIVADEGRVLFFSFPEKEALVHDLSWRNGLPLRHPHKLAKSGDDHVVALDRRTGEACLIPNEVRPPEAAVSPPRLDLLTTSSLLIENERGEIYGILNDDRFAVWRDEQWMDWEVPHHAQSFQSPKLGISQQRLAWLISEEDGATAVCDTISGEWEVYENLNAALVAKLAASARIDLGDYVSLHPFASAEDRPSIAYLTYEGEVHFYDQKKWKSWKISEIAGPEARVTGTPFFNRMNQLSLPIDHRVFVTTDGHAWNNTGEAGDEIQSPYRRAESNPPADCPVEKISKTIYDRDGVCWMIDQSGGVWKGVPGAAVSLSEEGSPNPVANGATFYRISIDRKGNAFLCLEFGNNVGRHLAIRARHPLPVARPKLKEIREDTATVQLGDAPWHRWRVNEGEWSLATQGREHVFAGLPPGDHEVEVLAYNAELTPSIDAASVKITITALGAPMIDQLISRLSQGDLDSKELAVRKLRSQGVDLLPRLFEARSSANESGKWWLDALIQKIEEDASQFKWRDR